MPRFNIILSFLALLWCSCTGEFNRLSFMLKLNHTFLCMFNSPLKSSFCLEIFVIVKQTWSVPHTSVRVTIMWCLPGYLNLPIEGCIASSGIKLWRRIFIFRFFFGLPSYGFVMTHTFIIIDFRSLLLFYQFIQVRACLLTKCKALPR